MGVIYLPEGYKQRRHEVARYGEAATGETSQAGTVSQYEHWDGRVDATVRPKAFAVKLTQTDGAPANPQLVYAIAELEEATRELDLAKKVANPQWVRYATRRQSDAKARVVECQ